MKAIVIREFGPPETMRLEDVPTPAPGRGEVLIRVHAVSVNRTLDLAVRAGVYPAAVALPHVLGVDPSGVVAAVGEGVTTRKVGDRVTAGRLLRPPTDTAGPMILGVHTWGGYAHQTAEQPQDQRDHRQSAVQRESAEREREQQEP